LTTVTKFLERLRTYLQAGKKEETSEAVGANRERLDVCIPVDLDNIFRDEASVRLRFGIQPGTSLTVSLESTPGNFLLILVLDNATKQSSLDYVDTWARLGDQASI